MEKKMKKNKALAIATALLLIATVVAVSNSANAAPSAPNGKAVGYWTQSRLASAQPIELVVDEATGIGKLRVNEQAGKPSGKTSSGSVTRVSATDWPQGGPIAQTAVGKVFFTVGTTAYVCSGALATDLDPIRAIVLTAGHCAWNQVSGAFVTNLAFFPNYDAGVREPWYASALVVRNEFASQTLFNSTALANDWAFAVLTLSGPNSGYSELPDFQGTNTKNSYDLNVSGFSTGYTSYAFGYPHAAPFNGQTLKYAGATIFVDSNTKTTWGMNSSMTGGASGGPWLSNGALTLVDAVNGKLSSLNSYKYNKDSTKMYGPMFNARTTATFNAAMTATGDQRVSN